MARVDEQIRRARRESGLSQEALAERIGVPPAAVHRYEEGAQISSRHLELIAVATGKPVSYFLDGNDPASRNGAGIGGWISAALTWLSEPSAGVDPDVDQLLSEMTLRERSLAERERRLAERERALEERERELAPEPRPSVEEQVEPAPAERGLNLDALEHTLDQRAAEFPDRAEEWRAYIAFLREFVHADGELPPTFNSLVREVFRELLAGPDGR
jgi:transcriptional regulator with XRE-family HTH domain